MLSRFSFLAFALALLVALPASAQMRAAAPRPFLPTEARLAGGEFPEYSAILLGTKEVPANTSTARGYSFVDFDAVTGEISGVIQVEGLSGPAQMAHIHIGAAGTNGPVIVPATDISESDGQTLVFVAGTLTADQQTALMAGNLYLNVHTAAFPGGEVRAQILPTQVIQDARTAGVGATVTLTAYVERAEGVFTYLTDETGGLTVRQTSGAWFDAVASGAITTGTVVRLTGTLSAFRELLQINQTNATTNDLASFEIGPDVGFNVNGTAQDVTLADIGEAYEGELVVIRDVTITGSGTFTAGTSYPVADASSPASPVVLRVPSANDTAVDGLPIPTGPTTVLAIVGQFSTTAPDIGYQLLVIETYDVAPTATVQVIHNAPDPTLATVDVFVNGALALDDVAFRTATGAVPLPAYADADLEVRTAAGVSVFTGTYPGLVFAPGGDPVVLVAQGVVDPAQFAANPDSVPTDFGLFGYSPSRQRGTGIVGTLVVHGTPDAPAIDLRASGTVLVDDLFYTDAFPLALPAAPASLSVTTADGTPVAQFSADLTSFSGQKATVLASGFLNPQANQNGAPFALLVVAEDGTSLVLPAMGVATTDAPTAALALGVTPNPSAGAASVTLSLPAAETATVEVMDALGRRVATLAQGELAAGATRLAVPTLAPGVYVVRATTATQTVTTTLTVVR